MILLNSEKQCIYMHRRREAEDFPGEALRVMFDDVISVEKAPLGRILRNFRCVTSLPVGVTGSHVSHGSDRVHMHNRFPHFFLTIVVVQNV
jgi:hypothetical protein